MLKVDRELQLEDGTFVKIVVISCKYNPKMKCNYLSYLTMEDPEKTHFVPLKKENEEVYVDYSYTVSEIEEMIKGISLPSVYKLPDRIKSYVRKDEKFFITSIIEETTSLDLNGTRKSNKIKVDLDKTESIELPKMKATKVVDEEPVSIHQIQDAKEQKEQKNLVLRIRLNDSVFMLFKVESSTEKEYSCSKISLEDLKANEDKYEVITSTLSLADFYKLKGESNITTSNNLNTRVPKFLIIDDKEPIQLLMVKYDENVYFPFIIKNETDSVYEVVETDKNFIEPRPYDLVVVNIHTKEEFLNFKEAYFEAKKNKTAVPIKKSKQKNVETDLEVDEGFKRTA